MRNAPLWHTPLSFRHGITCNPGYNSYWRVFVPGAPAANRRGHQSLAVALNQALIRSPRLSLAWYSPGGVWIVAYLVNCG